MGPVPCSGIDWGHRWEPNYAICCKLSCKIPREFGARAKIIKRQNQGGVAPTVVTLML